MHKTSGPAYLIASGSGSLGRWQLSESPCVLQIDDVPTPAYETRFVFHTATQTATGSVCPAIKEQGQADVTVTGDDTVTYAVFRCAEHVNSIQVTYGSSEISADTTLRSPASGNRFAVVQLPPSTRFDWQEF